MAITTNIIDAIKVQFIKPIFEDDFVEKGMTAWLTDVEWNIKQECYKLYFDFNDFEYINDKYFKESYYSNGKTEQLFGNTGRKLFTAVEAGYYTPKHTVYFSIPGDVQNAEKFTIEIQKYLREVA